MGHIVGQLDAEANQDEEDIEQVRLTVPRLLVFTALIAISTCTISVLVSWVLHQRSLFPLVTISQFVDHHPACYIFRLGLVSSGVLLVLAGIMLRRRTWIWSLVLVSGVGLAGVAVVSPSENNKLHLALTGVFFGGASILESAVAMVAYQARHSWTVQHLFKEEVNPGRALRLFGGGAAFAWCCIVSIPLEVAGAFGKHSESKMCMIECTGIVHLLAFIFCLSRMVY